MGTDAVGGRCGTAEGSVGTEHCGYGSQAKVGSRLDMVRLRMDTARALAWVGIPGMKEST